MNGGHVPHGPPGPPAGYVKPGRPRLEYVNSLVRQTGSQEQRESWIPAPCRGLDRWPLTATDVLATMSRQSVF